jgi:hypothetical protein
VAKPTPDDPPATTTLAPSSSHMRHSEALTRRLTRAGKRRVNDATAVGAAGCYAVTRTLSCKNSGAMSAPFAQTSV